MNKFLALIGGEIYYIKNLSLHICKYKTEKITFKIKN